MAERNRLENQVREMRLRRGWSQEDLADRAGLSRSGVSAIEAGRLVPSAAAALALAEVMECRVEDLFQLGGRGPGTPEWAWPPARLPWRYWLAEVGGRVWRYPVEAGPMGVQAHDGVFPDGPPGQTGTDPRRTLVMACCDPAAGLSADGLARLDVRLIVLPRSSGAALELLRSGKVHVAGLHLSSLGNDAVVRERLGPNHALLTVARWEEGLALAPSLGARSVREVLRSQHRWVGREEGSGARQCLDELLQGRKPPRRIARDHRGVAEAVRCGWADVGVCLRLSGEEAGLDFLSVRQERYDLCFAKSAADDVRVKALVSLVRSTSYRDLLAALPGYDASAAGELRPVD